MSEGEVAVLRRDIETLSRQTDSRHEENQEKISGVIEKLDALTRAQAETQLILKMAVGTGQPGEGRLGVVEKAVEDLKKFKWQALAIVSLILLGAEHSGAIGALFKH